MTNSEKLKLLANARGLISDVQKNTDNKTLIELLENAYDSITKCRKELYKVEE